MIRNLLQKFLPRYLACPRCSSEVPFPLALVSSHTLAVWETQEHSAVLQALTSNTNCDASQRFQTLGPSSDVDEDIGDMGLKGGRIWKLSVEPYPPNPVHFLISAVMREKIDFTPSVYHSLQSSVFLLPLLTPSPLSPPCPGMTLALTSADSQVYFGTKGLFKSGYAIAQQGFKVKGFEGTDGFRL